MNIAMMTNNFLPSFGGVARSVVSFTNRYRQRRHNVLVVAPYSNDQPESNDLVTVPAVQVEPRQDFAMPLPIPGVVAAQLKSFSPDIIHAHHPFLLGSTALTAAARWNAPLVFTHHTMFEYYAHYASANTPRLQNLIRELSTGYANLCDCVFAPTPSVAKALKERGVTSRIEIIPTGINTHAFMTGSGKSIRQRFGISPESFVVGYVGRLAPEKNLLFLTSALIKFLVENSNSHALVVGDGPLRQKIMSLAKKASVEDRFHFTGTLRDDDLINAYHAMNIFAFASFSETQGLVLLEALAAGLPVVALSAPGSRDIIRPAHNGWLVQEQDEDMFSQTLFAAYLLTVAKPKRYQHNAQHSVAEYDEQLCADRALSVYETLVDDNHLTHYNRQEQTVRSSWLATRRLMSAEWNLWSNRLSSVYSAMRTK